jgi:hypothetical protein
MGSAIMLATAQLTVPVSLEQPDAHGAWVMSNTL